MYLIDFIYDGIRLSDLGCMVGSAVTSNEDSIVMGSVINLETVINHGSYISEIVNADYKEVYTCTFDIFRKPCGIYPDHLSDKEVTWFMRWLNRKEYKEFKPLYDDDISYYRSYMMGTFTEVKAISYGGKVVGFTLIFTSNSPFSYIDNPPNIFKIEDSNNKTFKFQDDSEELGSVYPKSFKVECKESGDLIISNSQDSENRKTIVKNCVFGEIIEFDCIHKVITSSIEHDKLYNDFNYIYPRINNTMKDKFNTFTISMLCVITIEYKPIRKVGVIT